MSKFRVQWTTDIYQDIDSITSPNSPLYDKELTQELLEQYGSVENFKNCWDGQNFLPIKAFTSHDGIDIMVGEPFFYFNHCMEEYNAITQSKAATIYDYKLINPERLINEGKKPFKFFSSREAIEEYLMMSYECISINDLTKWMNEDNEFNGIKIEELFDIIKSRLSK